MRAFIFLFLFGSTELIGLFLAIFWAGTARKRAHFIDGRWTLWSDRAFVLSIAVATATAGRTASNLGTLIGTAFYGLSPVLQHWQAWPIAIGLFLTLVAYLQLVWLADLEVHPPQYRWLKAMCIATILWAGVSFLFMSKVPFYPANLPPIHKAAHL